MNKSTIKIHIKNIAIAFVIAIFFIADRYLKNLALAHQNSKELIGNLFTFNFTPNYFIAFSLPISGKLLEISILLLIMIMTAWLVYLFKKGSQAILGLGLMAVILGSTSNLIDRLGHGYVIDYLYLKYFTVFNLADFLIVAGAVIIFFGLNKKTSS